jgi:crossover junction endodeoxyribonuclease RuvC
MTRTLSLDPSLTCFGWAAWLDGAPYAAGCIRVPLERVRGAKTAASSRRLAGIARALYDLVAQHEPARVVAECPTGGRNAGTAKALAQSFATTVTVCEVLGVPLTFVTPRAVKLAVTGLPDAEKSDVARGVEQRLGWRSTARTKAAREAETDAVAVGLVGT